MHRTRTILATGLLALMAACATPPPSTGKYSRVLDQLRDAGFEIVSITDDGTVVMSNNLCLPPAKPTVIEAARARLRAQDQGDERGSSVAISIVSFMPRCRVQ